MTKYEALKLALEALHGFIPYLPLNDEAQCGRYDKAITAIKEALANDTSQERVAKTSESVHEPVGWAEHGVINWLADKQFNHTSFLYDTPPQRTWVGLTDAEMKQTCYEACSYDPYTIARAIEAKLKEKNYEG